MKAEAISDPAASALMLGIGFVILFVSIIAVAIADYRDQYRKRKQK
jgi:Na+-transporting methylmalonyl-CoA/oxaloacetate decarboxylase gamma subunit